MIHPNFEYHRVFHGKRWSSSRQTVVQFDWNVNHTDQRHPNTPKQREKDRDTSHHKTLKTEFYGWRSRRSLAYSHELENLKLYLTITQVQLQGLHHRHVFGLMLRTLRVPGLYGLEPNYMCNFFFWHNETLNMLDFLLPRVEQLQIWQSQHFGAVNPLLAVLNSFHLKSFPWSNLNCCFKGRFHHWVQSMTVHDCVCAKLTCGLMALK